MKKQIALGLATVLSAQASSISWNVDQFGTVSSTAGTVSAANWNNTTPGGGSPWVNKIVTDLNDDTGTPSTLDISYGSWGAWRIQASNPGTDGDGSNNKELLNGYLNAGPAGWNPSVTASSVAISQIPYANYDVIVYFSSDVAGREGSVTDGTTTYYFNTTGPASIAGSNAVFAQATDTTTAGHSVGANYAVFSGLSGASRTITVQMRDNDEWGGIAGFQVVADLTGFPEFGLQPEDGSAAVGTNATFNAAAAADPAPDLQWEYSADGNTGWEPLPGQTSGTLLLAGVALADEGYYRVVATNINGSVTSESAFLDVFYAAPEVVTQPVDAYAVEGSTVQLSVLAFGYETLSYQWYKEETLLTGETSDTLVLADVESDDAGDYSVEITDSVEPGLVTTSDTATVFTFPEWDGLVSHDSFDTGAGYTIGELPLQDPSVAGYTGPWTDINFGDAEPAVISGSLAYSDPFYLGASGDRVGKDADAAGIGPANSGRTYRKLAAPLVVAGNTSGVRYMSWLYRNGNENAAADPHIHSVLSLYQDTGGEAPSGDAARRTFEAGVSSADFATTNFGFRYNDLTVGDLAVPVDADVHLFVVKFDLSADFSSDGITVWIDPQLGSGDPAGGVSLTGLDIAFDSLAFSDYASNSVAWDEVRWGSTFDSVTLNPNPPGNFAAWIAGYPGVGELDGFEDDADGDGLSNGVENYLGTDPGAPNQGITELVRNGNTVTFQHPRNPAPASDVSAAYRWSTDLTAWHGSGVENGGTTVTFTASPDAPVAGMTTVTAAMSGVVPAKLFSQLRVTQSP
jgi:hypothetical protein